MHSKGLYVLSQTDLHTRVYWWIIPNVREMESSSHVPIVVWVDEEIVVYVHSEVWFSCKTMELKSFVWKVLDKAGWRGLREANAGVFSFMWIQALNVWIRVDVSVGVTYETRKGPEEGEDCGGCGRAAERVTGKQTQGGCWGGEKSTKTNFVWRCYNDT